jgi:hypothetical protein
MPPMIQPEKFLVGKISFIHYQHWAYLHFLAGIEQIPIFFVILHASNVLLHLLLLLSSEVDFAGH